MLVGYVLALRGKRLGGNAVFVGGKRQHHRGIERSAVFAAELGEMIQPVVLKQIGRLQKRAVIARKRGIERLVSFAGEHRGRGVLDARLLDADIDQLRRVVRQRQIAIGLRDQQHHNHKHSGNMAFEIFHYAHAMRPSLCRACALLLIQKLNGTVRIFKRVLMVPSEHSSLPHRCAKPANRKPSVAKQTSFRGGCGKATRIGQPRSCKANTALSRGVHTTFKK